MEKLKGFRFQGFRFQGVWVLGGMHMEVAGQWLAGLQEGRVVGIVGIGVDLQLGVDQGEEQ